MSMRWLQQIDFNAADRKEDIDKADVIEDRDTGHDEVAEVINED